MIRRHAIFAVILTTGLFFMTGCIRTHNEVVLRQPKPLQVNIQLTGKLTLVVKEAHDDMRYITGAAPAETAPSNPVAPPATRTRGKVSPGSSSSLIPGGDRVVVFADAAGGSLTKAQVLRKLRLNFPRVKRLLLAHLVGEAHTGYLVPRGHLGGPRRRFVRRDNALRRRLYEIVSRRTGQSVAQVGFVYFHVRLRYLPAGVWVQRFDRSTGRWIWVKKAA